MAPIYAIGDVHGQLAKLQAAHDLIRRDGGDNARVVHLGDYVDRGPDSAGVIQFLIDGMAAGARWDAIKGNHDRMFGLYMKASPQEDPSLNPIYTWLHPRLGGLDTLSSYGVAATQDDAKRHAEARSRVPDAHLDFLDNLPLSIRVGGLFFAHAGIRPGVPLDRQAEDDLVWIRDEFLHDTRDHGALIVHGHTPVEVAMHCGNRVNLDTGAGYGAELTTAVFEGERVWVLGPNGRQPLVPMF